MSGRTGSKTRPTSKPPARATLANGKKIPPLTGERKTSVLVNKLVTTRTEGGTSAASSVPSFDAQLMELLGERFVAYNEYLLAMAANQIKQREKNDLENSVQSQLNAISQRLLTDQQMIGDLEQRLNNVKFMSNRAEILGKQEAAFTARLKDLEEATVVTEKIASAVEPNLHYLRTKNLDLSPGISSFTDALTKTVKLLDGMNVEPSDVKNVEETAENLAVVNRECQDLDEEINKLHSMVPACAGAVLAAGALKI